MSGRGRPDRSRRPPSGPVHALRLPEFRRARLSSGAEVWIAENHDVPEVSLRLLLEAGAAGESPERAGVAELAARLLTEGAGDRDAMGMAEWLDRLGATFHASVRHDLATLSMHFLSHVTAGALDYLAAAVREPRFEAEEVGRVRQERLDEIERERDEPSVVAGRLLAREVYGEDHVYGRPAGGTGDTVSALDRDAVRGFHAARYGASGAAFVVCGDVRPGKLIDALEDRFGDWAAGAGRPPVPDLPPRPASAGRVILVDRPGSPQSEIRIGTVGIPHDAPDLFPVKVANAVLGGLFNSRINMNLREDKGWTYGARTAFRLRRAAGPFVVRTAVETAVTGPAFRELLSEIGGLATDPPTREEMELAKNAMTLSLPLQFETNGQIGRKVAERVAYDLPEDYWETYRDRVEGVASDEVAAVAERHLRPEGLVLVAATDAGAVRSDLEAIGDVEVRPWPSDPGGPGGT